MSKTWRVLAIVAVVALQLAGWRAFIAHNLGRVEALMATLPAQQDRNLVALSADTLEYRDYFRDFPTTFGDLAGPNALVEYYKRPLFGPVTAFLTASLGGFGISHPQSMFWILSAYATTATSLFAFLILRAGVPVREALMLSAVAILGFGWLSVFSIPESYSLAVCGAAFALWSGQSLKPFGMRGAGGALARHLLVTAAASWLYLPSAGAALLVITCVRKRREWMTHVIPGLVTACALALLPQLIGPDGFDVQLTYGRKWASIGHLVTPSLAGQVTSAFMFWAIVAPVGDFLRASPAVNFWSATADWLQWAGVGMLAAAYGWLGIRIARHNLSPRLSGPIAWLVATILFHLFFNPREVLLYLSVGLLILLYAAGVIIAGAIQADPADRRPVMVTLCALLIVLILLNVRVVAG